MSKLTHTARAMLPAAKFALPPKPGSNAKGSYPIDTIGRARDALSRGAANASPAQLAVIKRRVHAAYPSIKIGGDAGK